MSDNFGFETIDREQADQDENITSTSVTEDVGADAPEEDMFREDEFPQKGANLLDDSISGGGDMYSSEVTPSEPLINFGSSASEPTAPSLPQKNDIGTDSAPVSTKTFACQEEGCWMKTVDPRDDIARTSLKSDMDDSSPSNCESTSPSFSAESLTGPFHGGGTDIGNLTSDSNKCFDQDSDSSSIVSSSDNVYSSSADESDSESGNEISDVDSPVATETLDQTDKLGACKPDTQDKQNINSAGLDYKQLKMEVNKENVSGDSHGSVEDLVQQDVDAIVENDEIETVEKELPGGAEFEPECAANVFDNVPVAGLSEIDMLDVIERLTKEDNSPVETCSAESIGNLNKNQAITDDEYERFIRGEEVLSVDNTSPVVSDNDSIENESGSGDSAASDSDNANSCTDSDLSGDEEGLGNWSPSPLYAGILGSVTEDGELDDNEAMDVEESGVLAGYEYEEGDSRVIHQDNELNSLRADVKGLMEEMEAIVNENDGCTDNTESQAFVDEVVEEMDKSECEKVPEVLKGNEHIVSIMRSGSRERSRTPDNESIHVKFQSPTNILFYDPDCPILERVAAEVADELIDHDQTYSDQQATDLNTIEHGSNQKSENNEPEDLGAAVVKDLKDVYYNLEAKGEIDGSSGIVSSSDNTTIDDIASEFCNEVMEEAREETFESTKNHDKQERHTTDSLYRKRSSVESDIKSVADHDNQDVKPPSESRMKNECDPFDNNPHLDSENTGASLLPQNNVDIESEKEMKSQLLAEKDELGSKDDELTGIVGVDPDAVEMRPKHERIVKSTPADIYEEDFVVGHDIDVSSRSGSMIIHDEDDSDVQNDVAEAVKITLAAYRPSRIRALNEEIEASMVHDDDVSSPSSMIIHDVDDTVPSDVSEAVKQTFAAYTTSPIEATEANALNLKHQKVGLDEVERKRRYSSEFVDVGDHDYLINNQIKHDYESEEESVEEQLEAFDSSLNETVIAANSNEFEESIIETFDKENNEDTEQKLSDSADVQSDLSVGDKNSSMEHISPFKKVSDTMKWVLSEVLDLIYWRDVKKTGIVFGTMLFILLSLTCFTILSVAAYLSLAILTVTLSFRVYKNVMQAVQKTNEGHPFKKLLAVDIDLSEDVVQNAAEKIAGNMNNCCKELRRLFLIEDYVDSLKFGLLLWLMTYVGSWFNGMTLVILAVVCIFTLPKVYETYQGPIDQNVNLVRAQLNNIMTQVSSKIPFPKKKAKTQ